MVTASLISPLTPHSHRPWSILTASDHPGYVVCNWNRILEPDTVLETLGFIVAAVMKWEPSNSCLGEAFEKLAFEVIPGNLNSKLSFQFLSTQPLAQGLLLQTSASQTLICSRSTWKCYKNADILIQWVWKGPEVLHLNEPQWVLMWPVWVSEMLNLRSVSSLLSSPLSSLRTPAHQNLVSIWVLSFNRATSRVYTPMTPPLQKTAQSIAPARV